MENAERRAHIDLEIEKELLDRLKLGTYNDLYEDLLNLNKNAFEEHVNKQNVVEDDLEKELAELEEIEDIEYVMNEPINK